MLTKKLLTCHVHAFGIERNVQPPRAMPMQSGSLRLIQDAVLVVASSRRKPRMKLLVDLLYPGDTDVRRKIAIGSKQPAAFAALAARVKVDNLPCGMYAGVCSPRTYHTHIFIGDDRQRFFQTLLYAETCLLPLPAVVGGPVVLNAERDPNLKS